MPCLRRARDIDGIDGRIAEYPIRVFGAGETRALGGRRGAGGLTRIPSGDVGEALMLLHLGEKLPPDSTKANDSELNFQYTFPYPFIFFLSSGNCFCFLC